MYSVSGVSSVPTGRLLRAEWGESDAQVAASPGSRWVCDVDGGCSILASLWGRISDFSLSTVHKTFANWNKNIKCGWLGR